MRGVKSWFKFLLSLMFTVLVIVVLFVVIFVVFDREQPSAKFWVELFATSTMAITSKITWYSNGESERLEEQDIVDAKKTYFKLVDDNIKDIEDFDKFLEIFNDERKKNYIKRKIGSRTPENCKNYDKILRKYTRKADKLHRTTSVEIMTNSDIVDDTDTRDFTKVYKRSYLTISTVVSFACSIVLACVAVKDILWNLQNLFKYATYVCTIGWSAMSAFIKSKKYTGKGILDHLSRMSYVITKYINYKGVVSNGETIQS